MSSNEKTIHKSYLIINEKQTLPGAAGVVLAESPNPNSSLRFVLLAGAGVVTGVGVVWGGGAT